MEDTLRDRVEVIKSVKAAVLIHILDFSGFNISERLTLLKPL